MSGTPEDSKHTGTRSPRRRSSRRRFLKQASAAASAALLAACSESAREAFFQAHFKELSKDELKQILARLEREHSATYKKRVTVGAEPAQEGVLFGYGLDLSRCIGCRRCVYACVKENNQSRSPQVHWIRVLEMDKAKGVDLSESNAYYNPDQVPSRDKFYMPVQCQQCDNPPCVKVCPVEATWKEPDGIVAIDYDWCIGCRYCMAACPYEARRFNYHQPSLPASQLNTNQGYLSNRVRPRGVVEKCHFCMHRTRRGAYPACLEACPTGARKFGDINDPDSEVHKIVKHKRVFVLKEELNTVPHVFYYFD